LIDAPVVGCDRNDRREDHQTDGDTGEPGDGLAVDHAEDREDEDERADELGGKRLRPVDPRTVGRDAQADDRGLVAEHADDGVRADDAPTTCAQM
jgi:hypothetical protein